MLDTIFLQFLEQRPGRVILIVYLAEHEQVHQISDTIMQNVRWIDTSIVRTFVQFL